MIELKNFKGYFLDLKTLKVFSSRSNNFIKPKYDGNKKVFVLYKDGISFTTSLFEILQDNIKSIAKELK